MLRSPCCFPKFARPSVAGRASVYGNPKLYANTHSILPILRSMREGVVGVAPLGVPNPPLDLVAARPCGMGHRTIAGPGAGLGVLLAGDDPLAPWASLAGGSGDGAAAGGRLGFSRG